MSLNDKIKKKIISLIFLFISKIGSQFLKLAQVTWVQNSHLQFYFRKQNGLFNPFFVVGNRSVNAWSVFLAATDSVTYDPELVPLTLFLTDQRSSSVSLDKNKKVTKHELTVVITERKKNWREMIFDLRRRHHCPGLRHKMQNQIMDKLDRILVLKTLDNRRRSKAV